MARLRLVLRLGSPFDYGARGFNVNTLLPLVEFSKGDANPKISFPSFRLSAEGSGEEPNKKMQGNFWVCRAPLGRAEALPARSERTWRVQATTHAARAKSGASPLEMGSRKG